MSWVLKSESDTDKVFAEVDKNGDETGSYRYEFPNQEIVETNFIAASKKPVLPVALAVGLTATLTTFLNRYV